MDRFSEIRKLELEGDWQTRLFRYGFAVTAFETLSGAYLFFVTDMAVWDMMLLLFHLLLGFVFVVPCIMFLLRHVQYRRLFPDRLYGFAGAATAAGMFLSLGTGVFIMFAGVTGHPVLWWVHIIGSFLCVAGLLVYIWMTLGRFAPGDSAPAPRLPERGRLEDLPLGRLDHGAHPRRGGRLHALIQDARPS